MIVLVAAVRVAFRVSRMHEADATPAARQTSYRLSLSCYKVANMAIVGVRHSARAGRAPLAVAPV